MRDLAERGVLDGRLGAYGCRADVAEISVPATLQATIAARIDRLEPPAKRTLCAAAVIWMRFDTDLLASMGVDPVVEELLRARDRIETHARQVATDLRADIIRATFTTGFNCECVAQKYQCFQ